MTRFSLWCLLLLLAALWGAAPATAQYTSGTPDPSLDEMKYRAIYGRPPPPPAADQAREADAAGEGETTTTEAPKPRYRFSNDPLLNAPGQRVPEAASAPSYPPAPERPPARGSGSRFPAGLGPPSALPQREIRVLVADDQGNPVPLARVSLSTRQRPFFREGLTDAQGSFTAMVPCYVPGGEPMLSHRLRVSSDSGFLERLVVTRRGLCGTADQVSVILADPDRLDKMMRGYQERQEQYEVEEEEQKAKEEKEREALPAKGKAQGKAAPGAKKAPQP